MILEIKGNALAQDFTVLAHQCNCRGAMGAGIAKAIRAACPPAAFEEYRNICRNNRAEDLIGKVMFMETSDGRTICNVFGQRDYRGGPSLTEYDALERAFDHILWMYDREGAVICIPGFFGCGLAGGDWDIVFDRILLPRFRSSRALLLVAYLDPLPLLDLYKRQAKDGQGRLVNDWHGFPKGTDGGEAERYLHSLLKGRQEEASR